MEYNIKHGGQVFTPDYLVDNILDTAGYIKDILNKHIIDNSCGDGAFLCAIVSRYISRGIIENFSIDAIRAGLETFIHGIEIAPEAYSLCIENLTNITLAYNITDVKWDIQLKDALREHKYDGKMDFVVGNPPYVRVHNLGEAYQHVKDFKFAVGGMTDLYLVFFELGFRMLKKDGHLCYITPSSWLSSVAGKNLREHIILHKTLVSLINLGHFQPFKATTYTLISLFENNNERDSFDYYEYNSKTKRDDFVSKLTYNQSYINGNFYLGTPKALDTFRKMRGAPKCVAVKNGFATLADDVFISTDFPFTKHIIPCLKASTGKWYKAFYPYNAKGDPLRYEDIFNDKATAQYLNENKKTLLKGCPEYPGWYLYGRTQALRDVGTKKIAINTTIKDISSIKLAVVEEGAGIYSGLYILTSVPFEIIENVIKTEDFINYLKILKKYKSGGYYTFNSKELETYLNYKLYNYDKSRLSTKDFSLF